MIKLLELPSGPVVINSALCCSRLLVQLVEQGTHDQLLEQNGIDARLWKLQVAS